MAFNDHLNGSRKKAVNLRGNKNWCGKCVGSCGVGVNFVVVGGKEAPGEKF